MGRFRIIIANEPRFYREVIAAGLKLLRAHIEITVVDPADIIASVAQLQPQLLVCSELTDSLAAASPTWILLPIDDRDPVVFNVGGERTTSGSIEFQDLLSAIDLAEQLQPHPPI
ncbi:MAG TPA: hypothetical protein VFL82_04115 [Thermomicrobiales bacterium]|nr:hypothetical protein [Thermomicrobiales bacterium]